MWLCHNQILSQFVSGNFFQISDDNGWRSLGESKLFAPRLQIRGTQCLTFTYQIRVLHSFSKARLLVMINSQEVWFARGGQNFIEGEVTGQVSLSEGVNHISFLGEQGGDYLLIQTSLADGGCIALSKYNALFEGHSSSLRWRSWYFHGVKCCVIH